MFFQPQTKKVPIQRLLLNLEKRLAQDSSDVKALYYLARTHSMAYAAELKMVNVTTNDFEPIFSPPGYDNGLPRTVVARTHSSQNTQALQHLTNAIGYYELAADLVMQGTNKTAHAWLISPIHLGLAWCLDQSGRRADAIKAYRRALQIAWQREVDDGFSLKEQLNWSWARLRAGKNPVSKPPSLGHLGPGVCFSGEIIGYLLQLLDPKEDAEEIAQLKEDQKILTRMPRAITPILLPIGSTTELSDLVNPEAGVAFDLDGSGWVRQWGWITPQAAWLVYDQEGSGRITSGLQLVGGITFWIVWQDGYDALRALDDNGDGVLREAELHGLSLWQDGDGNGVSEPGEVRSVTAWGILELRCCSQVHPTGIPFHPSGALMNDGSTRPTFDWSAKGGLTRSPRGDEGEWRDGRDHDNSPPQVGSYVDQR